jgi:hypothetical protein
VEPRRAGPGDGEHGAASGELFTRHEEGAGRVFVLWNDIGGKLDVPAELGEPVELGELPAASVRESAAFYFDWARTDLFDAVKWQLARGDADLDGNPFHLLVCCYRAGLYPFSFGRREVTLFRFAARCRRGSSAAVGAAEGDAAPPPQAPPAVVAARSARLHAVDYLKEPVSSSRMTLNSSSSAISLPVARA